MKNKDNKELKEPIFILKKKKYFGSPISIFIIWVSLFICIGGIINSNHKITFAIAFIMIFWLVVIPNLIKEIKLYDDFLVLNYTLWNKKSYYDKIKVFTEIKPYIASGEKEIMINANFFMKSLFDEYDYKQFENILKDRIEKVKLKDK